MAKALIFDCFGVLTTDSWREFVAKLPAAQRQKASDLNRAYGAAFISKAEFLNSIKDLTGKKPTDIDKLLDNEAYKNTDLLQHIARLKPAYKISLLSNVGSSWISDKFLTADERALFDDFLFSYKVRMAKPDPRIFMLAAERLGVLPAECVLVDDVESYCAVARELGMGAVLYKNFPQAKSELDELLGSAGSPA